MTTEDKNFTELVLTGGPAAGKSSALAYLTEALTEDGVKVLSAPEIPTLLINGGLGEVAASSDRESETYLNFQRQMIALQRALRQSYQALAAGFAPQRVCIIYDRAELDCNAYLPEGALERLLAESGRSLIQARDSYDAVICLRTSAHRGQYNRASNPARFEDAAAALAADQKTLESWLGHPHLRIIDARDSFEDKIAKVIQAARRAIGIGGEYEIERKYLLSHAPELTRPELAATRVIEIEQTYLLSAEPNAERRVRCRQERGAKMYHWAEKRPVDAGGLQREERERLIDADEYQRWLGEADPERGPVHKYRHCFEYRGRQFELDRFTLGEREVWLLEVELLDANDAVELPPFLSIEREVTGEPAYKSAGIAAGLQRR